LSLTVLHRADPAYDCLLRVVARLMGVTGVPYWPPSVS